MTLYLQIRENVSLSPLFLEKERHFYCHKQLQHIVYVILFFFFHRWCFPRTIFNCPYNFLKLPNGLTGVTIFELSVGMLIILESCRTEILECNSQPSDTHRDTVYTGRGVVEKERNNGCFFENWLCFQMAQHSTSHLYCVAALDHLTAQDCNGVPEINKDDLLNEKSSGKLYFSFFLTHTLDSAVKLHG